MQSWLGGLFKPYLVIEKSIEIAFDLSLPEMFYLIPCGIVEVVFKISHIPFRLIGWGKIRRGVTITPKT